MSECPTPPPEHPPAGPAAAEPCGEPQRVVADEGTQPPGEPVEPPSQAAAAEAAPAEPDPTAPAADPSPWSDPREDALRLAEALIFSSAAPVAQRALTQLLPDNTDVNAVIAELRERYAGRGVELVDAAGGVQFRTAPDLGPRLRKVVEVPRRLPRVAMETLAIIAYHQPVTRPEIEEIRGTALSQQTLDALLEANLVAPRGRRESPGRPTLWGTTPQFLAQFGLNDLRDLPRREDLLLEAPQPAKGTAATPTADAEAKAEGEAAAVAPADADAEANADLAAEAGAGVEAGAGADAGAGTDGGAGTDTGAGAKPD